jgi:hypothetical protein
VLRPFHLFDTKLARSNTQPVTGGGDTPVTTCRRLPTATARPGRGADSGPLGQKEILSLKEVNHERGAAD